MRQFLDLPQSLSDLRTNGEAAIRQHDYETALSSSRTITSILGDWVAQQPALPFNDAVCISVLMVAHRPSPDHSAVIDVLGALDPARYQIIMIENSADPIFGDHAALARPNFHLMNVKLNFGMGIARQLALLMAAGRIVVFLDDDGLTTVESIEQLVVTLENYASTAVRGRIRPKTPDSITPPHYDPGNRMLRRFCDTEGMSAWNRQHMLNFNGFDPLLYGHEGADLTARMYAEYGPEAFLYQPDALMLHDFSATPAAAKEKKARYDAYSGYLALKNADFSKIRAAFHNQKHTPTSVATLAFRKDVVASRLAAPPLGTSAPSLTFLTTSFNSTKFIPQWMKSLQSQTDTNFQVLVVDDGSTDGTADLIASQWQSDIPIRIERCQHLGRGATLRYAVEQVTTDVCMIADIDDRSLPQRVEWTRHFLQQYPDADMLGFTIFDVNSLVRMARPMPSEMTPLAARAVFGMPAPFPAFSWRKDRITVDFNPKDNAASDCDWMYRALFEQEAKGYLVPLNLSHYGLHAGQISNTKRDIQRSVALRHLAALHDRILPEPMDKKKQIGLFSGWTKVETEADFLMFRDYCLDLYERVGDFENLSPDHVRRMLRSHLAERTEDFLRRTAEKHRIKAVRGQTSTNSAAAELNKVLASRSWRLTKPLRRLGDLFRR